MNKTVKVISLPTSSARRAAFAANNAHIDFELVDAVDGVSAGRHARGMSHLASPALAYRDGALGCALSHRALWQRALAEGEPLTVAEDDAILRHDFHAMSEAVIAELPSDWEIVLHGWNFDSVLSLNAMPAVSPAVMLFDQAAMRTAIPQFQRLRGKPAAFRLNAAFGTMAYSISPAGARSLLDACFPLAPFEWFCAELGRHIPNIGIDVAMCRHYPHMRAYCNFPPLAVSRNEMAESTIGPR